MEQYQERYRALFSWIIFMVIYDRIAKLSLERGFYFPPHRFTLILQQVFGNTVPMGTTLKINSLNYGEENW